ncbi:uncharacterized protein LOC135170960 [Diachasmimorpha longicaudata]|uniref:uncharacterized protein LOC135170960 n=1 Tax=Diachasmimorpha longicaudata TaxID=58733 RepID=UPI0030B8ADF9
MSHTGRLRLDDVISSVPELGPTLPDGGYSWIVLAGAMVIQMTVPTITSMYGVVLGYLALDSTKGLDSWQHEIGLTPILFTAFLSLADPWSRVIVHLAAAPRLIGFIGVCLLSIGVLASGYLATGGVGAYLASSSAGAVMGIGGSFILVQTESLLRRNFRSRLRLALTLKEVATSLGFVFAPVFAPAFCSRSNPQIGLFMIACSFIPAAVGTLAFRTPIVHSRTSPYTLLISDEDNELTDRVVPDKTEGNGRDNNSRSMFSGESRDEGTQSSLSRNGNDVYNFQDPEEDREIFSISNHRVSVFSGFRQKCQIFKSGKFWVGAVACVGCKAGGLFFWILLPSLATVQLGAGSWIEGMAMSVTAGWGTLIPRVASYWQPTTARWRSFCFGGASWLGGLTLLALCTEVALPIYGTAAFLGGVSVGGTSVCLESSLFDAMGSQSVKQSHTMLSSIVGLSILAFSFIKSPLVCLQLTAAIQFLGGTYWILVPLLGIIRAR